MPLNRPHPLRRFFTRPWVLAYLALLAASHLVIAVWNPSPLPAPNTPENATRINVEVPRFTREGPTDAPPINLSLLHWPAQTDAPRATPVLLLHGSPSTGATDFRALAPRLARDGWNVYALDRPGYGASDKWIPDYSVRANARYALAALHALQIERAHLVGWSLSGAVITWMAHLEPQTAASLVALTATITQQGEGSGDYYFEHLKYLAGWVGLVALPEAIPHFNLLTPRALRHAFIRDFLDTDQRPLGNVLRNIHTPTLFLHGRHDPLVPAWAAEHHHRIAPNSRLVILDASHFFPVIPERQNFETAARIISGFMARHDTPGAHTLQGSAVFAPQEQDDATIAGYRLTHNTAWWAIVLIIALATFVSEDLTVIAVGLLVSHQQIDVGVGLLGCFVGIVAGDLGLWLLGRFAGRRVLKLPLIRRRITEQGLEHWARVLDKHTAKAVFLSRALPGTRVPTYIAAGVLHRRPTKFIFWVAVAVFLWTPILLVITMLVGPPLLGFFERVLHGPWAIAASFAVLFLIIRVLSYEATEAGRYKLRADLKRVVRHEFWPPFIFYLPLAPVLAFLALRHKPMTFTCVNPGVPNGGGVVGESKHRILHALPDHAPVLHQRLITKEGTPEQRAHRALTILREDHELNGLPVILKPDESQRGHAVKLARTEHDVGTYFQDMTRHAVMQRFHPGPHEAGVLWARVPTPDTPVDDWPAEIFSVTRKTFPVLEGDGEHNVEQLIWRHPRLRMQARTFLRRFEAITDTVPAKGERLPMAVAGNHVQGTMFSDGQDLITPELTHAIDHIARNFRDPETNLPFDFGRFDLRYESEDQLRQGRGFAIVELNGCMSESTNIYDPNRSPLWAYATLFRQWARLYAIGAARRREGVKPLSAAELRAHLRKHFRGRPGSPISD